MCKDTVRVPQELNTDDAILTVHWDIPQMKPPTWTGTLGQIKQAPGNGVAARLAEKEIKDKRFDVALRWLDQAKDQESPLVLDQRARLLLHKDNPAKDVAKALELVQKAVRLDGGANVKTMMTLRQAWRAMGDKAAEKAIVFRILALTPDRGYTARLRGEVDGPP